MTSEEKKLLQAKHRLEEAQARDRVKERKARTRRLIQEGAVIENGWEVSGKPGAFLFFIPKGALTHHLLKQAVVALPLVGHVRSPRGIAAPAGAAGQGCISTKLPALPMQSAQGFPLWKPLFMGWYIATPSRRLPASTCHRQLDTDTGVERFAPPLLVVRRISRRTCCNRVRKKGCCVSQ